MNVGQTVSLKVNGETVYGVVRTEPTLTPSGEVVSVELLPDFQHLLPTGWTNAGVDELETSKVCACAHLGYRPIWGDHEGELITTGCDFSRSPKGRFLPGHDAKAKGFLIKASGYAQTLTNGLGALEQAREFGDKIALAVAKGMDASRKRSAERATSRRWRSQVNNDPAPTTREDQLTDAQKLQRDLGVTNKMLQVLARASVDSVARLRGSVLSAPAGTAAALQRRGLVSYGAMTDLGYRVVDQPTLAEDAPELVECTDEQGSYTRHNFRYEDDLFRCVRCGAEDNNR